MVQSLLPKAFPFDAHHVRLYLVRIRFFRNVSEELFPEPSLVTLERILDLHIKSVPFGALSLNYYTRRSQQVVPVVNKIDPYSTRGVNTDPLVVFDKLVVQKREGYCFEHNSLLRNILGFLGYDCISTCARIFDPFKAEIGEEDLHDITHWVNLVKVNGTTYLVDGGYSHFGTLRPVPVDINAKPTQCEGKVIHRIIKDHYIDSLHPKNSFENKNFRLEVKYGTRDWKPVYIFGEVPFCHKDLEALSFYFVHSPDKVFAHHILLSKFIPGGYISLVDNELTTRINGQKVKVIYLQNEQERRDTYRICFGINIPEDYEEHIPSGFGTLSKNVKINSNVQ